MNTSRVALHSITFRNAVMIAAGFVLAHCGLIIWLGNGSTFPMVLISAVQALISGLATLSLLYAARCSKEYGSGVQAAWLVMAVALLVNTLGEVITITILLGLLPNDFPTLADWFFLSTNPLVAFGILILVMTSLAPSQRFKTLLDTGIFFIVAILFCSAFLIFPIIAPILRIKYSTLGSLAFPYSLVYAVMDTVLFFASLQLLYTWRRSADRRLIVLLLLGATGLIATDVLGAVDASPAPIMNNFIGVSWSMAYILVGLAGFWQAVMRPTLWKPLQPKNRTTQLAGPTQAPYLWVVGACLLLLWNYYSGLLMPEDVMLWGMVAIIGLVLIRQFLSQQENTQLQAKVLQELEERRRAEQSLRLLEKAFATTNVGITISDLQGKIIYTNPAEAHLHGYTVDELLGKPANIFAPSSRTQLPTNEEIRRFASWQRETLNARKDGSVFPAQLISDTVTDANGNPIGIVTCCQDISERKQAEQALQQAKENLETQVAERTAELQESEKRFRAIFENAGVGIALTDLQAHVIDGNSALEQFFGYSLNELKTIGFRPVTHPDDALNDVALAQELFEGKRDRYHVEKRHFRKDGALVWGRITVSLARDGNNKPVYGIGMIEDITERKRAEQALTRRANELRSLYETSLEVNAETDLDKLLQTIINRAARLIEGDIGSLHLLDPDNQTLRLFVGYNLDDHVIGTTQQLGEGIAGYVAQTSNPIIIDDFAHWDSPTRPYKDFDVQYALGVPLVVQQKGIGVIVVAKFQKDEKFTDEQAHLVRLFADQAALAIDRARLYDDVQLLAITDELTGIYNRRGLFQFGEREVERALRFQRPLSAIMFDIDHFKSVNDQYGHAIGDYVLRAIAESSLAHARHLDILGRYGGEEFVLLLPETDCAAAIHVANRLRQSIQGASIPCRGNSICVSVSMGLAEATSETRNLATLVERADQALLRAKQGGRNRVEIFGH